MNAVRALFLHRPQAVLRLFYTAERRRIAGPLCRHLARTRRPYREVPPEELARIAGTQHHGGIVAIAQTRFAAPLPGAALPADLPEASLLPVLDGIGNPHNLGAIARSAAFFGARALLLSGDQRQADLSDAAFRTAEGGLEHLEVLRARDLPILLKGMRSRVLTVAAVAAGGCLAFAMRTWYNQHPGAPDRLDAPARTRTPEINLSSIPVAGDVAGLIFAVGSVSIVMLGLPQLRWFFLAAVAGGLLIAGVLAVWHTGHPASSTPRNSIASR